MKRSRFVLFSFAAGLAVLSLALLGCELDNADSVTRDVDADFTGFYAGNSGPLVSQNSGAEVTSLNLRQTGDEIELIDNNGLVFRGTLGEVNSDGGTATATFQFTGETTAGNAVTGSGTLTGVGTSGTMTGTWIEPSLYGTISGIAVINPVVTNSPSPTPTNNTPTNVTTQVSISAVDAKTTLTFNGDTTTLLASGGTGTGWNWSLANSPGSGTLNNSGANPVTYTRQSAGNNTVTVKDSGNNAKSITLSQP